MCGRKWFPFVVVLLVAVLIPFIDLVYAYALPGKIVLHYASDPLGDGCVLVLTAPAPTGKPRILAYRQVFITTVLGYSAMIASDLLVFIITCAKTVGIWRAGGKSGGKFKLVTVLLRNGTLYFCALLNLSLVTLISMVLNLDSQFLLVYTCEAVSNVLVARFILDLRGVFSESADDDIPDIASSVQFAASPGAQTPLAADRSPGEGEEPVGDDIRPLEDSILIVSDELSCDQSGPGMPGDGMRGCSC